MQDDDNTSKRGTVSVIIPALNEAPFLSRATAIATDAAQRRFRDYEIIIVNDGSTDGTGDIADGLAEGNQHISVVHHDQPHNLGGAFKSGLARAKMDFVAIYLPGDESLSRPSADRSVAHVEAARNRGMAWKFAMGVGWFFGGFALVMTRVSGHGWRMSASCCCRSCCSSRGSTQAMLWSAVSRSFPWSSHQLWL